MRMKRPYRNMFNGTMTNDLHCVWGAFSKMASINSAKPQQVICCSFLSDYYFNKRVRRIFFSEFKLLQRKHRRNRR